MTQKVVSVVEFKSYALNKPNVTHTSFQIQGYLVVLGLEFVELVLMKEGAKELEPTEIVKPDDSRQVEITKVALHNYKKYMLPFLVTNYKDAELTDDEVLKLF